MTKNEVLELMVGRTATIRMLTGKAMLFLDGRLDVVAGTDAYVVNVPGAAVMFHSEDVTEIEWSTICIDGNEEKSDD